MSHTEASASIAYAAGVALLGISKDTKSRNSQLTEIAMQIPRLDPPPGARA